MSNYSDIKFIGLDNILEKLDKAVSVEKVNKALTKACLLVQRSAMQKAQIGRGTGELARSIAFDVKDAEGVVYTPLEYAPYVEYGTGAYREVNPQPGYWIYVRHSTQKSQKSGKRYSLEEAKEIVALMRAEGLDAVYTDGREPQPFMRPALDENRENIKRILEEGILND